MRPRVWVSLCLISGIAGMALLAISCGSSNNAHLRLLNAMVTQSSLDMLIDGNTVASSIAYGTASSYASVSSGSRHVQVEPAGSGTPVIDTTQSVSSGNNVTVLAYLNTLNSNSSAFLIDNNSAPNSGDFNLRVINAAPAVGPGGADVYVVPAGTNISGVNPNFSALQDNGSASSYLSLTAGNYDIIFAVPGTKQEIAQSLQAAFGAGQVRTVLLLNSQSGGSTVVVVAEVG
jgi:hypothetical protein